MSDFLTAALSLAVLSLAAVGIVVLVGQLRLRKHRGEKRTDWICTDCLAVIEPGDLAIVMPDGLQHETCPEDVAARAAERNSAWVK